MLDEEQILEALEACFDTGNPFGKPLTVVDLGSVDSVVLTVDRDAPGAGIAGVPVRQRLSLTLTPASQDEDARAQLAAQIRNRLAGIEGLSQVSLELTDATWSVDRMSPEARRKAGIGMFAILNNKVVRLAVARRPIPIYEPKLPPVHPFDRLYGTDTGGLIPRRGLATGHANDAHVTAYYAVAPSILDGLIDLWLQSKPPFGIEHYTFLDIGAGKGRGLMTASLHPFERVTGIELNPGLAKIARTNLQLFAASDAASQLAPAEVVEGDALEVPLPESPTLAFLFHPFEAPVLRAFLARVAQVYRGSALDILYVNAEHAGVFNRHEAFEELYHGRIPMSSEDYLADLAEIVEQTEYGSTGDEICGIYRLTAT